MRLQLMKSKSVKSRIELIAINTFDHKVGVVGAKSRLVVYNFDSLNDIYFL